VVRPALYRPRTLAEACELLAADERAMAYGGGTAIQIRRRLEPAFASAFVDLSAVPGLDRLSGGETGLRVGPMVTIRRMETDPLVARVAPLAAAAYGQVANPRVRNAASVGGNLSCGAYRLDPPAALLALGTVVEATSVHGVRRIAVADFFADARRPAMTGVLADAQCAAGFLAGTRRTALEPGELITAVEIPALPPGSTVSYVKLCSLSTHDWPCASAAACLVPDGSGGRRLRLAIGALGAVPRLTELPITDTDADEVVSAALAAVEVLMDPIPDVRGSSAYKRALGRVAAQDAVRRAWQETGRD
jgi:carbon-monoxide dehydrogenase medium subunit